MSSTKPRLSLPLQQLRGPKTPEVVYLGPEISPREPEPTVELQVMMPDYEAICIVPHVTKTMTIDDLMDAIVEQVNLDDPGISLQGWKENSVKEFYGLYLPFQKVRCREFKRLEEYGLFPSGVSGSIRS